MKKLLVYLLIVSPLVSFAQRATTEVEYNYLTRGYQADIADGRDIKSGYSLQEIGQGITIGAYTFHLHAFIKTDEKAMVAILVIANSQASGKNYYLCVPLNNAQLFQLYFNELEKWDAPISRAFAYVNSTYYAGLVARDVNIELQK